MRFPDRRTDHEIELVAIIGKTANAGPRAESLQFVAGYCLGLDITLRGPEDRSFRKSIDSYSVLGPWLTTADEVADPQQLRLTLHNNGELRQDTPTSDMVIDVARIIEFATRASIRFIPAISSTPARRRASDRSCAGDRLRAYCKQLGTMDVSVRAPDRSVCRSAQLVNERQRTARGMDTMGLRGSAAVVIWSDMPDASQHDHWHSHEHLPERASIPGFCAAGAMPNRTARRPISCCTRCATPAS